MALPANSGKPPGGAPDATAAQAAKAPTQLRAVSPPAAGATAPATPGAQTRRLKKGDLLFNEGDSSRAMFFLKVGMIRLFKKKGEAHIEIDTIRAGEVLGELAFLDGNPRSASGEALTECELVEISGATFQSVLAGMPSWLKIMLKTVVGRLRTASTRIRQLEQASTAFEYSEKEGTRAAHYVYISPTDAMKIGTGILLATSRNGKPGSGGTEVRVGMVQRYVNQIMGVPAAKITTFLDVLAEAEIAANVTREQFTVRDPDFVEQLIAYLNEENLAEPEKRHDITVRGFLLMSLIAKHLGRFPKNEATGLSTVNLVDIRTLETPPGAKDPFRVDEVLELVDLDYSSNVNAKSSTESLIQVQPEKFMRAFKFQRIVLALKSANEQKRKAGSNAK